MAWYHLGSCVGPAMVQRTNGLRLVNRSNLALAGRHLHIGSSMKVLGAVLLGVVIILGIRYAMQEGLRGVVTSVTSDQAAACLSLSGSTTAVEDGFTDIIGTFKNECNRKFSQVTVSFKLDRSSSGSTAAEISTAFHPGAKTNSAPRRPAMEMPEAVILAYARDVKPGETRKFKSSTHISKNAVFRFDKISGF